MEAVVADFRHGLALWPGSREEAERHHVSLGKSCEGLGVLEDFNKHVRVLLAGKHVDSLAMEQMAKTNGIPRRVMVRFERGDFG
jgi:hypothetical protein